MSFSRLAVLFGVAAATLAVMSPGAHADVRWCSQTGALHKADAATGGKLVVSKTGGRRGLQSAGFTGTVTRSPKKSKRRCISRALPVAVARDGTPVWPGRRYAWLEKKGSRPVALARDGFGIYGGARKSSDPALDSCNGHRHRVRTIDGSYARVYHYHATGRSPFTVGCLNASPSRDWALVTSTAPIAAEAEAEAEAEGSRLALTPAFAPAITDYVVRCSADTAVSLATAFPAGSSSSRGTIRRMSLAPGQAVTITVPGSGAHHVRCLPADFPSWTTERFAQPQSAFYIFAPTIMGGPYIAIADDRGTPVWWYKDSGSPLGAQLLDDGNLAFARSAPLGHAVGPGSEYHELGLDGTLGRTIAADPGPTDFHELEELPNGNMMILVYRQRDADLTSVGGSAGGSVLDAEIQEIEPDGDVVWTWSSATHIGLDETQPRWVSFPTATGDLDIMHPNSIDYVPETDQILLSNRHADALYMIDHGDGSIVWKLGGTPRAESLDVIGDPQASQTFGGQHDARIDASGKLTVHDNRSESTGSPVLTDSTPRAVEFHVDDVEGEATYVGEVTDPTVTSSFCCGSARKLAGGNWVVSWGGVPVIGEYSDSGPVLRMNISGVFSYRVDPVAPGELDIADLRSGMDAQVP